MRRRLDWAGRRRFRHLHFRGPESKMSGARPFVGPSTVGCPSSTEEDPLPVAEAANSIYTADDGEFARAGIVRTAGQLLVDRFQRCGVNMHDHLSVTSDWVRGMLKSGRLSESMQNGSIHHGVLATGSALPPFYDWSFVFPRTRTGSATYATYHLQQCNVTHVTEAKQTIL